ncbi:MAG TPA: hypothetical protein VLA77_03915 [Candidatus Saccharimonadales bacterium]|nr:hypothetical protein [Candidatus Saccharimonadales bacterium]
MTITNHVLAGAIIGLTITNPFVAVVLAFASHFFMDALPHFGYAGQKGYGEALKHKMSFVVATLTLLTTLIVVGLIVANAEWFALLTGLIAASPDAVGIYNWLAYEKQDRQAHGILRVFHVKFHRAIQWCERPWGVIVEVAVFVILFSTLIKLIYV